MPSLGFPTNIHDSGAMIKTLFLVNIENKYTFKKSTNRSKLCIINYIFLFIIIEKDNI